MRPTIGSFPALSPTPDVIPAKVGTQFSTSEMSQVGPLLPQG